MAKTHKYWKHRELNNIQPVLTSAIESPFNINNISMQGPLQQLQNLITKIHEDCITAKIMAFLWGIVLQRPYQ